MISWTFDVWVTEPRLDELERLARPRVYCAVLPDDKIRHQIFEIW